MLQLFSDIVKQGYKIVYLTTRPIGQASMTKDYLEKLSQEDATLPQGPVLLSPESLFHTTTRRERLSHVFKISALRGIRLLFPEAQNPYHAGFGNQNAVTLTPLLPPPLILPLPLTLPLTLGYDGLSEGRGAPRASLFGELRRGAAVTESDVP